MNAAQRSDDVFATEQRCPSVHRAFRAWKPATSNLRRVDDGERLDRIESALLTAFDEIRAGLLSRLDAARPAAVESAEPTALVEAGDLTLDREALVATVGPTRVKLSPVEARILDVLVRNTGRIVHRQALLRRTSDGEDALSNFLLDVQIKRLQELVKDAPTSPCRIMTVSGVGFRYRPPDAADDQPAGVDDVAEGWAGDTSGR